MAAPDAQTQRPPIPVISYLAPEFRTATRRKWPACGVGPGSQKAPWAAEYYREQVNGRLEGRARIELMNMTFPQALASVQKGDVQMALISSSALASAKVTNLALFDLPFFFEGLPQVAAMQNTAIGEAALGALNAHGMVGLAYWNSGMSQFFGTKPVQTIGDLKNLKLRTVTSPPSLDALGWLGVTPSATIARDVDRALDSGNIVC